jgi:hypothetical protein
VTFDVVREGHFSEKLTLKGVSINTEINCGPFTIIETRCWHFKLRKQSIIDHKIKDQKFNKHAAKKETICKHRR